MAKKETRNLTAVIEREGNRYVAFCPELDVSSQGFTIEEARRNLTEAVELLLETASPSEIEGRLASEIYVTNLEIAASPSQTCRVLAMTKSKQKY